LFLLYDDQRACLHAVSAQFALKIRRVLLCAPTGAGKTIIACFAAAHHADRTGGPVWILEHREELIDQTVAALRACDIDCGVVNPSYDLDPCRPIQVVSVFSILNRIHMFKRPSFLIVDEAHHAVEATTWGKIIATCPEARVLGLTATPCRQTGGGLHECFDKLVLGPSTEQLQAIGRLSKLVTYAPSSIDVEGLVKHHGDYSLGPLAERAAKVTGDVIKTYQRLAPGKKFVAFCVSVDHAHKVAEKFRQAGIVAVSVDGTMDRFGRHQAIAAFRDGSIQGLVSCDLVSEGFDVPDVEVGISLRPTASLRVWLQQSGRILRATPGKERAILLDHAGNCHRHGLPTETREWTLHSGSGPGRTGKSTSVRMCESCFGVSPLHAAVCVLCGKPFTSKGRKVIEHDGELSEVDEKLLHDAKKRAQSEARSMQALVSLGKERGYKNPHAWAYHIITARRARGRL
jgi:DNA repair protein RadD